MVTADDLLPALVSVLTEALHNLDSALLVAQEVPDWRQKYGKRRRTHYGKNKLTV